MTAQLTRMTQVLLVSSRALNVGTTTQLRQGIMTRMAETTVPNSGGRGGGKSN
jgi:hypothetical protein